MNGLIDLDSLVKKLRQFWLDDIWSEINDSGGIQVLRTVGPIRIKEADGSPDVADVNTVIVANGTLTDNGGGSVTLATGGGGGGGTGDVVGPAGAVDGHLVVFDGTTGKLVKDGGAIPTGSSLTVKELDGSPSVANVTEIKLPNGTLTDNTGGSVTYTPVVDPLSTIYLNRNFV